MRATDALYQQHRPIIERAASVVMRCNDNGHALGLNRTLERDDLIQAASVKWVGLVRAWDRDDLKHLERRIFRAAINAMFDYIQSQDKHKKRRLPEEAGARIEDPDQVIGIDRIDMRKVLALPIVERRLVMDALGLTERNGHIVGAEVPPPNRRIMAPVKPGRARRQARQRIEQTVLT